MQANEYYLYKQLDEWFCCSKGKRRRQIGNFEEATVLTKAPDK